MSKTENIIAVELRKEFGDNPSRRLRKAGYTPAVIYSRGQEPKALQMKTDEWLVAHNRGSHIYTLQLNGESIPAIVKEVQYNYLKNYVYHVDFQQVDLDAEIVDYVDVHAFGDCYGASHGGVLEQLLHRICISCRPTDLPDVLKVDVTSLNVGDTLTVGQLVLPKGVKLHNMPEDEIVFHVVLPTEEAAAEESETASAQPEAINEQKTEARAAEKDKK